VVKFESRRSCITAAVTFVINFFFMFISFLQQNSMLGQCVILDR
jgi:hypothetical protein